MDDRALTEQLVAAARVQVTKGELDALFSFTPELTEWSMNAAGDRRGTLRTSVWTKDRGAARAVVERFAPGFGAMRDGLVGEDFEGVGLAMRGDGRSSFRWWALADERAALAERARRAWPEQGEMIESLLAATGGPATCAAVGVEIGEAGERRTLYAELRTPERALRVLELARIVVSQPANLFWKGIVGLDAGGQRWPRVWVGRSVGPGGGWKFYYFARGDELRRTDEVLLDAVSASAELGEVWMRVRATTHRPCVQLIGLTFHSDSSPSFTTYLSRI
ncbi:MAG TPA: hypothetical protein VGD80_36235 [Kofleriaceae bacterium]